MHTWYKEILATLESYYLNINAVGSFIIYIRAIVIIVRCPTATINI